MLEVRGLRKSYGRKKNVLNDVSFTVPINHLTCLIGLNGEGKSTILKAIMGIRVDAEEELEGLDVAEHGSPAYSELA